MMANQIYLRVQINHPEPVMVLWPAHSNVPRQGRISHHAYCISKIHASAELNLLPEFKTTRAPGRTGRFSTAKIGPSDSDDLFCFECHFPGLHRQLEVYPHVCLFIFSPLCLFHLLPSLLSCTTSRPSPRAWADTRSSSSLSPSAWDTDTSSSTGVPSCHTYWGTLQARGRSDPI